MRLRRSCAAALRRLVQKLEHIAAARRAAKRGLDPGKTNAAEAAGTGSAVLEEVAKRAKGGVLTWVAIAS